MRVAIVNDLAVACEALRRAIAADPALSVAWIARDGAQAVEMAVRDRPDIVLMDLIMPVMDGVEATRRLMRVAPCPILVVTATVTGNASRVYEALGAGALDAVNTPSFGVGSAAGSVTGVDDLLRRIHRVGRAQSASTRPTSGPAPLGAVPATLSNPTSTHSTTPRAATGATATHPAPGHSAGTPARAVSSSAENPIATPAVARPVIVAIGASTGGPRAVAEVLRAMPSSPVACTLVVQHVSCEFVAGYAAWLSTELARPVGLARAGAVPQPGEVLVASEDRHLVLTRLGTLDYREEPASHPHRPSVDELFLSLAAHAPAGVAVLLTGMGRDGADGMLRLRQAGWHTIAQDEATSVVWGMPGAAHRAGAAVETLPLHLIGGAAMQAVARLAKQQAAGAPRPGDAR